MRLRRNPGRAWLHGISERRLQLLLVAFFAALAIPSIVLVSQAYSQLRWESFRQTQLLAEDIAARIDADLREIVAAEEARAFGDYAFLVVEGDAAANFVQRSILSSFPVESPVPGAIGYFQVEPTGELTTPLLPAARVDAERYGIAGDEQRAREALATSIRNVLIQNRLVQRPALDEAADADREEAPSERQTSAFDQLKAEGNAAADVAAGAAPSVRVNRLAQTAAFVPEQNDAAVPPASSPSEPNARRFRTEQALAAVPSVQEAYGGEDGDPPPAQGSLRVRMFESELEPFDVGLLGTGHLVLFRSAWRDHARHIQGVLIDRERFVAQAVERVLAASSLAGWSRIIALYGRAPLDAERGTLLHRARMSPPFGDLELVFAVDRLPPAPGRMLLGWVTLILAIVLCGGFLLMYHFGAGQIRLARQQRDFVSAVSHELKTPLTSIRMYGEMLKAGWGEESKKQLYYDYIHGEAERLSRLIENVLQLARLTRGAPQLELQRITSSQLLELVTAKVATQVEQAGFHLDVRNEAPDAILHVDADCFIQIVINLVDNALKFAAAADRKVLEIGCRSGRDGDLLITVRDFGPGIDKAELRKIFALFYRPKNELTRATAGTGIGLALVQQLVTHLGGGIEVRNAAPGAEFRLSFQNEGTD